MTEVFTGKIKHTKWSDVVVYGEDGKIDHLVTSRDVLIAYFNEQAMMRDEFDHAGAGGRSQSQSQLSTDAPANPDAPSNWGTKAHKKASVAAYTSFKDAVLPHLSNPQWQEILVYEMAKRLCYGCGADNHLIKNCPKANVSGGSGSSAHKLRTRVAGSPKFTNGGGDGSKKKKKKGGTKRTIVLTVCPKHEDTQKSGACIVCNKVEHEIGDCRAWRSFTERGFAKLVDGVPTATKKFTDALAAGTLNKYAGKASNVRTTDAFDRAPAPAPTPAPAPAPAAAAPAPAPAPTALTTTTAAPADAEKATSGGSSEDAVDVDNLDGGDDGLEHDFEDGGSEGGTAVTSRCNGKGELSEAAARQWDEDEGEGEYQDEYQAERQGRGNVYDSRPMSNSPHQILYFDYSNEKQNNSVMFFRIVETPIRVETECPTGVTQKGLLRLRCAPEHVVTAAQYVLNGTTDGEGHWMVDFYPLYGVRSNNVSFMALTSLSECGKYSIRPQPYVSVAHLGALEGAIRALPLDCFTNSATLFGYGGYFGTSRVTHPQSDMSIEGSDQVAVFHDFFGTELRNALWEYLRVLIDHLFYYSRRLTNSLAGVSRRVYGPHNKDHYARAWFVQAFDYVHRTINFDVEVDEDGMHLSPLAKCIPLLTPQLQYIVSVLQMAGLITDRRVSININVRWPQDGVTEHADHGGDFDGEVTHLTMGMPSELVVKYKDRYTTIKTWPGTVIKMTDAKMRHSVPTVTAASRGDHGDYSATSDIDHDRSSYCLEWEENGVIKYQPVTVALTFRSLISPCVPVYLGLVFNPGHWGIDVLKRRKTIDLRGFEIPERYYNDKPSVWVAVMMSQGTVSNIDGQRIARYSVHGIVQLLKPRQYTEEAQFLEDQPYHRVPIDSGWNIHRKVGSFKKAKARLQFAYVVNQSHRLKRTVQISSTVVKEGYTGLRDLDHTLRPKRSDFYNTERHVPMKAAGTGEKKQTMISPLAWNMVNPTAATFFEQAREAKLPLGATFGTLDGNVATFNTVSALDDILHTLRSTKQGVDEPAAPLSTFNRLQEELQWHMYDQNTADNRPPTLEGDYHEQRMQRPADACTVVNDAAGSDVIDTIFECRCCCGHYCNDPKCDHHCQGLRADGSIIHDDDSAILEPEYEEKRMQQPSTDAVPKDDVTAELPELPQFTAPLQYGDRVHVNRQHADPDHDDSGHDSDNDSFDGTVTDFDCDGRQGDMVTIERDNGCEGSYLIDFNIITRLVPAQCAVVPDAKPSPPPSPLAPTAYHSDAVQEKKAEPNAPGRMLPGSSASPALLGQVWRQKGTVTDSMILSLTNGPLLAYYEDTTDHSDLAATQAGYIRMHRCNNSACPFTHTNPFVLFTHESVCRGDWMQSYLNWNLQHPNDPDTFLRHMQRMKRLVDDQLELNQQYWSVRKQSAGMGSRKTRVRPSIGELFNDWRIKRGFDDTETHHAVRAFSLSMHPGDGGPPPAKRAHDGCGAGSGPFPTKIDDPVDPSATQANELFDDDSDDEQPQEPTGSLAEAILGEQPRCWYSQFGLLDDRAREHAFYWCMFVDGRPDIEQLNADGALDLHHSRVQGDWLWNHHADYGSHRAVEGVWELLWMRGVDAPWYPASVIGLLNDPDGDAGPTEQARRRAVGRAIADAAGAAAAAALDCDDILSWVPSVLGPEPPVVAPAPQPPAVTAPVQPSAAPAPPSNPTLNVEMAAWQGWQPGDAVEHHPPLAPQAQQQDPNGPDVHMNSEEQTMPFLRDVIIDVADESQPCLKTRSSSSSLSAALARLVGLAMKYRALFTLLVLAALALCVTAADPEATLRAAVTEHTAMGMYPIDRPWDMPQSYNSAFQAEMLDISAGEFEALSDTGAYCVLTGRRELFRDGLSPCSLNLTGFSGSGMTIRHRGPVTLGLTTEDGAVSDIVCTGYYHDGYHRTIIAPGTIARENGGMWIYRPPGSRPPGVPRSLLKHDGMYIDGDGQRYPMRYDESDGKWYLKVVTLGGRIDVLEHVTEKSMQSYERTYECWHDRLCHMNDKYIFMAVEQDMVDGIKLSETWAKFKKRRHTSDFCPCDGCFYAKSFKPSIPRSKRLKITTYACEFVWMDTCELEVRSVNDYKHCLSIIDDFTRYRWVYFLRTHLASEMLEVLRTWYEVEIKPYERRFGRKLACIGSDNGTEFKNELVRAWRRKIGIAAYWSPPDGQAMNGIVERFWRWLFSLVRACLITRQVPKNQWTACARHVTWTVNRMPTHVNKKFIVPYMQWFRVKPNLKYARPFFARAMIHLMNDKRQKLDGRAREGNLLCYDDESQCYIFSSIIDESHSREVVRTIFVRFIENERPGPDPTSYPPLEIGGTVHKNYTRKVVTMWDENSSIDHPHEFSPDLDSKEIKADRVQGKLSKLRKLAKRLKFPYARDGDHVRSLAFHKCVIDAQMAGKRLQSQDNAPVFEPGPPKQGTGIVFTFPRGYNRLMMTLSSVRYIQEQWGLMDGVEIHSEFENMVQLCEEGREADPQVTCMHTKRGKFRSFAFKILAILRSKFQHVLFLDSDSIPLVDPRLLFQSSTYSQKEMESGQLLVDTQRHHKALRFALKLAADKWVQRVLYGDKDCFRFAWIATRSSFVYAEIPDLIGTTTISESQHGSSQEFARKYILHSWQGQPAFVHQYKIKTANFTGLRRLHIPLSDSHTAPSLQQPENSMGTALMGMWRESAWIHYTSTASPIGSN
eukprot:g22.t1